MGNRHFYTEDSLMEKIKAMCLKIGSNVNRAHREGLRLWLKEKEKMEDAKK